MTAKLAGVTERIEAVLLVALNRAVPAGARIPRIDEPVSRIVEQEIRPLVEALEPFCTVIEYMSQSPGRDGDDNTYIALQGTDWALNVERWRKLAAALARLEEP